jgi:hypothetical protein
MTVQLHLFEVSVTLQERKTSSCLSTASTSGNLTQEKHDMSNKEYKLL